MTEHGVMSKIVNKQQLNIHVIESILIVFKLDQHDKNNFLLRCIV